MTSRQTQKRGQISLRASLPPSIIEAVKAASADACPISVLATYRYNSGPSIMLSAPSKIRGKGELAEGDDETEEPDGESRGQQDR